MPPIPIARNPIPSSTLGMLLLSPTGGSHSFRYKQFVLLHPTTSLSGRSNLLPPTDCLLYMTLLETNKPYLMNVLVGSALHLLLLFAQSSTCGPSRNNVCTDSCSRRVRGWLPSRDRQL